MRYTGPVEKLYRDRKVIMQDKPEVLRLAYWMVQADNRIIPDFDPFIDQRLKELTTRTSGDSPAYAERCRTHARAIADDYVQVKDEDQLFRRTIREEALKLEMYERSLD